MQDSKGQRPINNEDMGYSFREKTPAGILSKGEGKTECIVEEDSYKYELRSPGQLQKSR